MFMAAISGSITSLAFLPWTTMTFKETALTLFVGFSFAVFVAPAVGSFIFHIDEAGLRIMGAITYIGATGANAFIPRIIKWITRRGDGA